MGRSIIRSGAGKLLQVLILAGCGLSGCNQGGDCGIPSADAGKAARMSDDYTEMCGTDYPAPYGRWPLKAPGAVLQCYAGFPIAHIQGQIYTLSKIGEAYGRKAELGWKSLEDSREALADFPAGEVHDLEGLRVYVEDEFDCNIVH